MGKKETFRCIFLADVAEPRALLFGELVAGGTLRDMDVFIVGPLFCSSCLSCDCVSVEGSAGVERTLAVCFV